MLPSYGLALGSSRNRKAALGEDFILNIAVSKPNCVDGVLSSLTWRMTKARSSETAVAIILAECALRPIISFCIRGLLFARHVATNVADRGVVSGTQMRYTISPSLACEA